MVSTSPLAESFEGAFRGRAVLAGDRVVAIRTAGLRQFQGVGCGGGLAVFA